MSHAEWMEEGRSLFGEDPMKWRFVCPICGNVQAVEDYRQYKDKGADPNSAFFNCIGRYSGQGGKAFGGREVKGPCDYTLGGLFKVHKTQVESQNKPGVYLPVFEFDRSKGETK